MAIESVGGVRKITFFTGLVIAVPAAQLTIGSWAPSATGTMASVAPVELDPIMAATFSWLMSLVIAVFALAGSL